MWTTDESTAADRTAGSRKRASIAFAVWLLLFVGSFAIDRPVAEYFHDHGWPQWLDKTRVADVLKFAGEYWFTLIASILVVTFCQPGHWIDGALVACSGIVTGFNGLVKWFAGRARPFKVLNGSGSPTAPLRPFHLQPFFDGWRGIDASNLSFPSGHVALAVAVTTALAMLYPKWRWALWTIALGTTIDRIAETAHYVSDCVAAAGLGYLSAVIAAKVFCKLTGQRLANSYWKEPAGLIVPTSA